MAGFIPSAEFYAPDPNPDLAGTPFAGVLIRQQVLGAYARDTVHITSADYVKTNLQVKATSSAPAKSVILTAWSIGTNNEKKKLGQLNYNKEAQIYQATFKAVEPKPKAVIVSSTDGGSAIQALSGPDTVQITMVNYTKKTNLQVEAISSAYPKSVILTAWSVTDGGPPTKLGKLKYKEETQTYRASFKEIVPKPDMVIVTSSGGGTAEAPVP
jgi:hypothetical protein